PARGTGTGTQLGDWNRDAARFDGPARPGPARRRVSPGPAGPRAGFATGPGRSVRRRSARSGPGPPSRGAPGPPARGPGGGRSGGRASTGLRPRHGKTVRWTKGMLAETTCGEAKGRLDWFIPVEISEEDVYAIGRLLRGQDAPAPAPRAGGPGRGIHDHQAWQARRPAGALRHRRAQARRTAGDRGIEGVQQG